MDIKEILDSHAKWLRGESGGRRADLRGADLRRADLWGADLWGADLRGADLRDADLRDADLRGADLRYADLRDADLRDADLRGADLRDADLRGADLRDADLRDADLRRSSLRDADLWGCTGNNRQIKSLFISGKYQITYTAEYLQIGCQRHEISSWWDFDDEKISSMDDGALDWWRDNKDFIRMAIDKYPAVKTGK